MAIIKAVNSKANISQIIKYITQTEKTENRLISGYNCTPKTAIEEMNLTKAIWNKTGGRTYKHYIHSFAPNEAINPEKAHELAMKIAQITHPNHEILIATHQDKKHIHSHIIVNSVNFTTGAKLQQSQKDLQTIKDLCNQLSREENLSILQKGKTYDQQPREDATAWTMEKYKLLEKAEKNQAKSYLLDTAVAVMIAKQSATSQVDFIAKMKEKGYTTNWKDNRKYITFTDPEGHKIRNSNIEKTFKVKLSKEDITHELEQNRRRATNPENRNPTTNPRDTKPEPNTTRTGKNPISKNDRIRSRTHESRKPPVEINLASLRKKLQEIRNPNRKYHSRNQEPTRVKVNFTKRTLKRDTPNPEQPYKTTLSPARPRTIRETTPIDERQQHDTSTNNQLHLGMER